MSWKYRTVSSGIRLRVWRRRRADAVGAGRDRVPAELDRLLRGERRAPDDDRHPARDLVDRRLGDEAALLRRLGEPLPGRAVDEDAVHPLADVPLDERAERLEVEGAVAVKGVGQAGQ